MDDKELNIIWNTSTCEQFNKLNFDKMIMANNIQGLESYITYNKKQIEGYEVLKQHVGDISPTRYFIRTEDANEKIPGMVEKIIKVHDSGKIYSLVTKMSSFKIIPEKIFNWRNIIDLSGIPNHTNKIHYTLYKNKILFGRTHRHIYSRIVSESAFGKDKYLEAITHLLNNSMNVSDPSVAKLFYAFCHSRDITINELPDDSIKSNFIKFCNLVIKADGTNIVVNPSRSVKGTKEVADTSLTSFRFIHNIPSYYTDKGQKGFDDIYPYNVINRFYYNLYSGYLKTDFPDFIDFEKEAKKYESFYRSWIKSVLWYQENWHTLSNRYSEVSLDEFTFRKKEERFKDHFRDFAKCLSHYAEDKNEYYELLHIEYASHKAYESLLKQDEFGVEEEQI